MSERYEDLTTAVLKIRQALYNKELSPNNAAKLLNTLSALIGSAREEYLEVELLYNQRLQDLMVVCKTVTEAKTISKAGLEYKNLRERENLIETISDLMSSIKYTIKVSEIERNSSKYQ